MRKILVTGSNGMLGKALFRALKGKYELFGLGTSGKDRLHYIQCDISRKSELIKEVSKIRPDIIIHTAAISDVEYCENYPGKARKVNACGTQNLALAALKNRAFLIYVSTDYVFDGRNRRPYKEKDIPHPVNVYGRTKFEGEKAIRKILDNYLIIRTSWLFGEGRDNFVTEILKKAKKEKTMSIVADKFGSPTYTLDLAHAIEKLLFLITNNWQLKTNKILHISNSDSCSRYEFTEKILQYAGIKGIKINPVRSSYLSWKAKRPAYSVLDNTRFKKMAGYKLRPWQEALREYIQIMANV